MPTLRLLSCVLAVLFLSCATSPGWAQSTLIERSLEELRDSPPVSPEAFDFVVLADSNTLKPLEQSDIFKQCLRECNILKPNLVVQAGDIVLGGAAEGVPAQWDLFDQVIAACKPPYLPVPGNHDISDAATEKIWLDRIGPTRYAFEYGNSCFILLDSEEVGAVDRLSDAQVAWLKNQLDAATAKNIFVFLHKPYFAHGGDPDDAAATWDKRWAYVAETFRGHPVKAVFAGHEHIYRDCGTRDGVRYVICGGAAVYGMGGPEDEGSFNHYLLVRVRGEDVSWSVIKPFSVLPEDVVTGDRIDELYNVRSKWVAAEELCVPLGEPAAQDVKISITNPGDSPMKSFLTWEEQPGWTILPATLDYEAPSHGAANLSFHVSANADDVRFPVPTFQTLYDKVHYGPAVEVKQDLRLIPVMSAVRSSVPIQIDGKLDEWTSVQMAPLTYPVGFDAADASDLTCRVGFQWDEAYLYMAVETQDNEFHQPYAGDIVWAADCVEMFLDDWSWGLSLTANGPEVFLYWGIDVDSETVNTDVRLGVTREGTRIVYEAAFPQSHLTPLQLTQGNSFRFNMLMNDLDPNGPRDARHWLQLVPEKALPGCPKPKVKVVLEK